MGLHEQFVYRWNSVGLTAQTINAFVRMRKVINTVIRMSAEPRLVARMTSMFHVRLSRWLGTTFA